MNVFTQIQSLQDYLDTQKGLGKTMGFVPTMGALHAGHASLIQRAKGQNSEAVCSIFVNPTQFNESKDLKAYPIEIQKDLSLLENQGCQTVFLPDVDVIYPEGLKKPELDYGLLTSTLEGTFRPGHFDGMIQVVSRFFEIVKPHKAYFGEKDFQQLAIIQEWAKRNNSPIEIIGCEIIREKNGLALSSRNVRLIGDHRIHAQKMNQILKSAVGKRDSLNPPEIREIGMKELKQIPACQPEYFEIVESQTLEKPISWQSGKEYRILLAAWIGSVRLIDNMAI